MTMMSENKTVIVTVRISVRISPHSKSSVNILMDTFRGLAEDSFRGAGAIVEVAVEDNDV
jgi:hypothetical protein